MKKTTIAKITAAIIAIIFIKKISAILVVAYKLASAFAYVGQFNQEIKQMNFAVLVLFFTLALSFTAIDTMIKKTKKA